ncbi:MAG: hypothetical protein K2M80_04935, partial [Muribaculaceae bacterium]|nr:hypothetical protein [Muribaculaceae bacterium]
SKFGGNQLDTTTNYWIRISDGDYAGVIYYLDWTDVWNVPGAVKWGSKSYNNYVRKMGRINSGETQSIPFKKEFSIKTKQL